MTGIVKSPAAAGSTTGETVQSVGKSYVAAHPKTFLGQSAGTRQCVALVERAARMPSTPSWRRGAAVKGADLQPGTIIATFDPNGHHGNHSDGRSHAAICVGQNASGIQVIDQWVDPATYRLVLSGGSK